MTLLHLRDQAAAHPDKPAVITSSGASLSYGELDRRSRRLARALRERASKPRTPSSS